MEGRRLGLVQRQRATAFQNLHVTEKQVGVFGHHVAAARTSAAEDTSPVGVFAEHGALGQITGTDEASHAESFFVAFGLLYAQFNKLGSTFAITHNVFCEALHNEHQGRTELALFAQAQVFVTEPAHAVGKQDAGIVGAGVAVHSNGVEGIRNVGAEFRKEVNRERNVGGNEGQHGGHVGVNHARALAGATDGHHALLGVNFNSMALERKVGGEDSTTKFFGSVGVELFHQLRNAGLDFVHGHQVANHAGAADQHALGRKVQGLFGKGSHAFGILVALLAGTGIGVTAVHHHGRCKMGMLQGSLVVEHRSGLHLVGGKHRKTAGRLLALEKRHVGIAAGLDTCTDSRCREALGGTHTAIFQQIVHIDSCKKRPLRHSAPQDAVKIFTL